MPDKMYIVITLRRTVTDEQQGRTIYDLVKQRLADHPEVQVSGHVTNHLDLED